MSLQRQAVLGAFKCMYWLAKEETAHHTKFISLLQLAKSLNNSTAKLVIKNILALRTHLMLATFLRDVTVTFLSMTDTYVRTTHIMRIDPGLESSLRLQLIFISLLMFMSTVINIH